MECSLRSHSVPSFVSFISSGPPAGLYVRFQASLTPSNTRSKGERVRWGMKASHLLQSFHSLHLCLISLSFVPVLPPCLSPRSSRRLSLTNEWRVKWGTGMIWRRQWNDEGREALFLSHSSLSGSAVTSFVIMTRWSTWKEEMRNEEMREWWWEKPFLLDPFLCLYYLRL